MAKEVLSIPEEHLKEFIAILRMGILVVENLDLEEPPNSDLVNYLRGWCTDEQAYLEME